MLQELRAQGLVGMEEWWPAVQAAERATRLSSGYVPAWVTLGRAQVGVI